MARVCEITGKKPLTGNKVSHSNVHTKRRQLPNLQVKSMPSLVLNRMVTLKLSTSAIRTIDKNGGIDTFMRNVKNRRVLEFSTTAKRLRKLILKKTAETTPPKATKAS
jgi:large subunit ribosomal protein L28